MTETTEQIDREKLRVREQIQFQREVFLFEDKLLGHGVSMLTVRIVSSLEGCPGSSLHNHISDVATLISCFDQQSSDRSDDNPSRNTFKTELAVIGGLVS